MITGGAWGKGAHVVDQRWLSAISQGGGGVAAGQAPSRAARCLLYTPLAPGSRQFVSGRPVFTYSLFIEKVFANQITSSNKITAGWASPTQENQLDREPRCGVCRQRGCRWHMDGGLRGPTLPCQDSSPDPRILPLHGARPSPSPAPSRLNSAFGLMLRYHSEGLRSALVTASCGVRS